MPVRIKRNSGFSIIGAAIIIMLISAVICVILYLRTLIFSDHVQEQIVQFAEFDAASLAFRQQYGFIPGDIPTNDALRFNFSSPGSERGGNNKLEDIFGNVPNNYAYGENIRYFINLVDAKMLKNYLLRETPRQYDVGTAYPKAKLGNKNGVAAIGNIDGVFYFLGTQNNWVKNDKETFWLNNPEPALKPIDAYSLDVKLDDGLPIDGKVRAVRLSDISEDNFIRDRLQNHCVGSDLRSYNIITENTSCRLIIKSKVD